MTTGTTIANDINSETISPNKENTEDSNSNIAVTSHSSTKPLTGPTYIPTSSAPESNIETMMTQMMASMNLHFNETQDEQKALIFTYILK
eukprot:2879291-Ditylum_brightwellii.AAC.1